MNLVPIKINIGLREDNGQHKFPLFNDLESGIRGNMDWSYFVDKHGLGWHYDKCCSHRIEKPGAPFGMQWGMLLVPKKFADAAIEKFGDVVTKMTEVECEEFYNVHCHAHEPEIRIDEKVMESIKTKESLGIALSEEDKSAVNPQTETRGIRKNLNRNWTDFKKVSGTKIVQ